MVSCDPNAMTQQIQLVCKDADTTAVGCDHLHQGGAVGTVVRLPENVRPFTSTPRPPPETTLGSFRRDWNADLGKHSVAQVRSQ